MNLKFCELEKRELKDGPDTFPWWVYWCGWHLSWIDKAWLSEIGTVFCW